MSDVVVTVEPTVVNACVADGDGAVTVESGQCRVHVERPASFDGERHVVTLRIESADLRVAVELAGVDCEALRDGFEVMRSQGNGGCES